MDLCNKDNQHVHMVIHVCCKWLVFPANRIGACSGGRGGGFGVYRAKFTVNRFYLGSSTARCSFKSLPYPPFALLLSCCLDVERLFPGVGYGAVLAVCATSFAYAFTFVIKLLVRPAMLYCLGFPPVCSLLLVPTCHIGYVFS